MGKLIFLLLVHDVGGSLSSFTVSICELLVLCLIFTFHMNANGCGEGWKRGQVRAEPKGNEKLITMLFMDTTHNKKRKLHDWFLLSTV